MAGFDAIQTEVIARLGNRTDINARSAIWINDAYFELLMNPRYNFFEIELQAVAGTLAGQALYSLPPDLWFILDLRDDTHNIKLQRTHWSVLDKIQATPGFPVRYARFGMGVQLDPVPNGAFTLHIRYRKRVPELSAGSLLVTPREWDEAITLLAVCKGWDALNNKDQANATRQLFNAAMDNRTDVPTLEDMDAETTISPSEGFSVGISIP